MSKKKLNKKGQQARTKAQNNAPRIDATKTIYDVDAKVQAFKESECAEEANVDAGVVTNGTEIVDPVTEEVIETIGEENVEVIEPDADDEEFDNDIEEDNDEVDNLDEELDVEENDATNVIENIKRRRSASKISTKAAMKCANVINCANKNPKMVNTDSYGERMISAIHRAKEIMDTNDELLISSMRGKYSHPIFGPRNDVVFSTEFVNWSDTGYTNSTAVMDALEKQYNDFMSREILSLNDPDVKDIYYCNDVKTVTSGIFMHTGDGLMPTKGRVATIRIRVPKNKLSEFIEKYTTKICFCKTSDKIPPHIMALASEGFAPIDGVRAYYRINMPEFLKLFTKERDRNITIYDSDEGYSISISNYDRVNSNNVSLNAPSYESSLSIGLFKAAFY